MTWKIERSRRARADLVDIWTYIADDNPEAADDQLDRIETIFMLLRDHPMAGSVRDDIMRGLRGLMPKAAIPERHGTGSYAPYSRQLNRMLSDRGHAVRSASSPNSASATKFGVPARSRWLEKQMSLIVILQRQ
jgi:plasmid stabilization system protein ParE